MLEQSSSNTDLESRNKVSIPAKVKYQKSSLQAEQKDQLVQKLKVAMEQDKLYQETTLTLSKLSKKLHISTHALSQIINEKIGCSFLDFINSYRVREAMKKLQDPKYQHYTILSIGYEAGFNSKTAFYTAFRKQTNRTPGNFRKTFAKTTFVMG